MADAAAAARPGRHDVGGGRRTTSRSRAGAVRRRGRARRARQAAAVRDRRGRTRPDRGRGHQDLRLPRRHPPRDPRGGWRLPGPARREQDVGAAQLAGPLRPEAVGLATLPRDGARGARGRPDDDGRAGSGGHGAPGVQAPGVRLRRRRRHAPETTRVAGRHVPRAAEGRAHHLPVPRPQPALGGCPGPRRRGTVCGRRLLPGVRARDSRPRALLARRRARRGSQADPVVASRPRRPAGGGRRRGTARLRPPPGPRRAGLDAGEHHRAAPAGARPVGPRTGYGRPSCGARVATDAGDPEGRPGDRRWCRVRDLVDRGRPGCRLLVSRRPARCPTRRWPRRSPGSPASSTAQFRRPPGVREAASWRPGHSPVWPSIRSRSRSACPLCRAYSPTSFARFHRTL